MWKKQVLDSPFTNKEFLNLVKQFNEDQDIIFENFAISDKTIVNIGNRDFVDYRPSSEISKNILENNSISNVNFDSLHYFQIQKYYNWMFINQSGKKIRHFCKFIITRAIR